jgi:hypothetical protein
MNMTFMKPEVDQNRIIVGQIYIFHPYCGCS